MPINMIRNKTQFDAINHICSKTFRTLIREQCNGKYNLISTTGNPIKFIDHNLVRITSRRPLAKKLKKNGQTTRRSNKIKINNMHIIK